MRRTLSLTCLLLAWICANGAIWNGVQVVAWAKMIRDFSQTMSAARAVELTFSGEAPCKLCHLAQSGQDATRDAQSPAALGGGEEKILLLAEYEPTPVLVAPDFSWPGVVDTTGRTRSEPVPVPPPRV